MVKTTQKEIDEWKFQNRMKSYERELQSCSDKPPKGAPSGTNVWRTLFPINSMHLWKDLYSSKTCIWKNVLLN
jgi:hypothetical protein